MWELEDSNSESVASSCISKDHKEVIGQKTAENANKVTCEVDSGDESSDMEATLLCLVCNKTFECPETSQEHMECTGHENFEMVGLSLYE